MQPQFRNVTKRPPGRPRLYPSNAERQADYRRRQREGQRERVKVYHRSACDTWGTPPEVFDPLNARFHFTVDVCALPENAKCARYYSPADDGLAQDWRGETCWLNPPFGAGIDRWLAKAYESAQHGATVVCLVKAATDSRWWVQYSRLANEVHLLEKRVRFVGAQDHAPFPCCVFVFLPPGVQAYDGKSSAKVYT